MKKVFKITAVVMALALVISAFASCGGGGGSVSGETKTWGNITVLVPEGMTLKGGDVLNKEDPDKLTISKNDNAMNYFLITVSDSEDNAKSNVETTRSMNKGCKDVSVETEGAKWTGVTYDYSGTKVFQIYAKVDGRVVTVQSYGFEADSDTSKAVLGSLKIAAK